MRETKKLKRECNLLSSSVWIEGVLRLGIEKRVSDDEKRKKRVSDEGVKKKECEEHVSELISLPGRVMRVGEASDEAVCL
jgi:hypothetical protein